MKINRDLVYFLFREMHNALCDADGITRDKNNFIAEAKTNKSAIDIEHEVQLYDLSLQYAYDTADTMGEIIEVYFDGVENESSDQ